MILRPWRGRCSGGMLFPFSFFFSDLNIGRLHLLLPYTRIRYSSGLLFFVPGSPAFDLDISR